MLKNALKFEVKIGEKIYNFICDNDSPIEHVKDATFQFLKLIGQIEDQIKAQAAAQAEEAEQMQETPKQEEQ